MLYSKISQKAKLAQKQDQKTLSVGQILRKLREQSGKRSVELAAVSGVDRRTLQAIEIGRIKNPSLAILKSLTEALNSSLADLFLHVETSAPENVFLGHQKGAYHFEFKDPGFRVTSYTPFVPDFFIGKVVLDGKVKINESAMPLAGRVFISVIFGKIDCLLGKEKYHLKEGNCFLLNGRLPHSFLNPLLRESSFLMVTVPSFIHFGRQR